MELILHKVCGHPAQQAVTLRRCTPDEAPAVYALQNEVHAAMPHPEWFVTDTLEHITGYITDSLCIGVWQGSRLEAARVDSFISVPPFTGGQAAGTSKDPAGRMMHCPKALCFYYNIN